MADQPNCPDCGEPTTPNRDDEDSKDCPMCFSLHVRQRLGFLGLSVRAADHVCDGCTLAWCAAHFANPNDASVYPVAR